MRLQKAEFLPSIESQFFWFGIVGIAGFIIDAGVLDAVVHYLETDPLSGRFVSFLTAATTTWWLNRKLTFRRRDKLTISEWATYVALMTIGAVVNFGVFLVMVGLLGYTRPILIAAVAAGSLSGMCVNFFSARWLLN